MTSFGIVLAVVALLDAVRPGSRRLAAATIATATAATVAAAYVTGHSARAAVLLGVTVLAVEGPAWTFAPRTRRPAVALATLVAVLLGRLVTTPFWTVTEPLPLTERWLREVPFTFAEAGTPRVALVVGAALFLATAGNTLVRLLLSSLPGVDLHGTGRLPGGGRIIGSLERLLIFGLALAGEATAAALVVSAKGVLRFAEVRAAPGEDVDRVTEYVLVGSLASYALAMTFVPLAVA